PSPAGDGRIAFSPTIPDYWFDVARGEDLLIRAAEALTDYYKALEKEQGARFRVAGMESLMRAWVTNAELHFAPRQKYEKPSRNLLAALMGEEKMSGQRELQRVGRKIDALFPDSLTRAAHRETEIAELSRLLAAGDRRPILLVGPPMVGKTTLIHEYIFRRRKAMTRPEDPTGSLWLIAPQRLISGMMYSGQWENRLLAILDHMKDNNLVLYLDDLPGFYHAGISAQSNLNAAQVLRPYIERRDIRVVAEITPESLRILQERDRGFADLFHLLPVREPAEADARRILFSVIRHLEANHRCRLHIEVLPAILELQARYVRDLALPGKAAVFLSNLAAKFEDVSVDRSDVLREFHAKSGLSVGFLDRQATLDRKDVEKALRENIIGQEDAVQAMTDVVSIAKAQLNDLGRPLGSFLFLGPTGVGKTQAAKALAQYLFGSADRLLRFDMNEYLDPFSAQRLVGTWNQPEGLLTSAVRRQPYSVILLDEIEKADPAVFDLLLQVLGEGRLTDSLGRTSDFSNTLIIMTSNLGVREAETRFGFATESAGDRAAAFRLAAQAFFRPEFYNRIDRIVPFQRLSRRQTQEIASSLINGVLEREGLRQRRCMLSVMPAAMERIVDAGYQPDLGARALKRAIERQLTHPVAARLAAIEPGTPTLIDVFPHGAAGIGVHVRALPYADRLPLPNVSNHAATIKRIDAALDRLHNSIQHLRPSGRIVVGDISPAHVRYFAMKDQFDKIERLLERFEKGDQPKTPSARRASLKVQKSVLK
ncbi:MAG TPA: AAA family ATPase, partial [Phycisphaerae bacterium]|nr:AAA family ATPase [Phycisphaerae bacterium]